MIILVVVFIIVVIMAIWHTLSDRTFKEERKNFFGELEPRTKTNWNMIALTLNIIEYFSERGFEINKDIQEVEKEIEVLEKQKKKLDHLEELKMRRDRLFEEVNQKSND